MISSFPSYFGGKEKRETLTEETDNHARTHARGRLLASRVSHTPARKHTRTRVNVFYTHTSGCRERAISHNNHPCGGMALSWAQSKVDRFENSTGSSTLGPGDYDPCIPKSQSMAGAVSLGYTSSKGMDALEREQSIPEETDATLNAARDRTASAASKRSSFGGPRPALNLGMSRLDKVKAEQQAKQLAWAETEREKLQEEVKTLRSLQVRVGFVLSRKGRSEREVWGRGEACLVERAREISDDYANCDMRFVYCEWRSCWPDREGHVHMRHKTWKPAPLARFLAVLGARS